MSEAIVVGSGPNGLACGVALAREGVSVTVLEAEDEIGGGTRTSELTLPGLLHDDCSAVHPMAVARYSSTRSTWGATASNGAGPRSTLLTRSTTAARG